MAYSKIYSRINWENEPSTASPINENNLNRMDSALNTLDDRVVELSQNVETLQGYETRVAGLVSEAQTAKNQAQSSATTSTNQATLSKSYAIGGTGARSGEATDNAKYYKEQAEQAAEQAMSGTPEGYADLVAKVNSIYRQTATSYNLVGTSEGSALAHTIYGMSVQDGTPTPSVPVEIKSAKADFKCVGKNLIPYPYYRQSGYSSQGMTGTYGDDGIITINKEAGSATAYFGLYHGYKMLTPNTRYKLSMSLENANNVSVYISVNNIDIAAIRNKASGNYDYTFTTPNELLGITQMALYFVANDVETNCKVKVMLTLADVDQTYEVNQHTDVTTDLTLRALEVPQSSGYNLVKDGKYYIADTVDWSEDEGYVITRRIGRQVGGVVKWYQLYDDSKQINISLESPAFSVDIITSKMNRCVLDTAQSKRAGTFWLCSQRTIVVMFLPTSVDITSVQSAQTWIDNNPTEIVYRLATPTTEPITSEQAQALLSLKTYDEATSISATGDIEPSLDLEYSKDRNTALALIGHNLAHKNALKLNDINTALIELGGN